MVRLTLSSDALLAPWNDLIARLALSIFCERSRRLLAIAFAFAARLVALIVLRWRVSILTIEAAMQTIAL